MAPTPLDLTIVRFFAGRAHLVGVKPPSTEEVLAACPGAEVNRIDEARQLFEAMCGKAYGLADRVRDGELAEDRAERELRKAFPSWPQDILGAAMGQGYSRRVNGAYRSSRCKPGRRPPAPPNHQGKTTSR